MSTTLPDTTDSDDFEAMTIRVSGQDLRYAMLGPQESDRVLLVYNGIGASIETALPVARHFRDTRVLLLDIPGVGGSPTPSLPYRMSWIARLTARLLDALGIDRVDVLGVSWGGAPAQQFARDFPARIRSLTLAATSAGFVMVPGDPRVLVKLATPRRYVQPDYMLSIGPSLYGGQLRNDDSVLHEHASAMKPNSQRGYLYQLLAGVGWTSWLWLPRITVPTLVLMGEDDPIVPLVNGRMLVSRLPDAVMKVMDCGHLFMLTDPEGTAHAIEEFLNRVSERQAA